MVNSVDPDQTPRSAASDLGLHCLLRLICPYTLSKYGNMIKSNPRRNPPGSAPAARIHNTVQSNLNGSNIFGTTEIRSRHG